MEERKLVYRLFNLVEKKLFRELGILSTCRMNPASYIVRLKKFLVFATRTIWCLLVSWSTIELVLFYQSYDLPRPKGELKFEVKDFEPQSRQSVLKDVTMPMKDYTQEGCSCLRPGYDIDYIKRMQKLFYNQSTDTAHRFRAQFGKDSESTCSDYSTQRGIKQWVFSYSYYNPNPYRSSRNFHRYLVLMDERAVYIKKHFPKWTVRIYHNLTMESDPKGMEYLCYLYCSHDHVDLCFVGNLPTLGNLAERQPIGRLWRFAVLGDPTVEIFSSRDTDSYILPREEVLTKIWLRSGNYFHVIRDHPGHKPLILAGLISGNNSFSNANLKNIRQKILAGSPDYSKSYDQSLLAQFLWPFIKNDTLQHDSYTCTEPGHENASFIPIRREPDFKYVGWGPLKVRETKFLKTKHCPKQCRPPNHQDWAYC